MGSWPERAVSAEATASPALWSLRGLDNDSAYTEEQIQPRAAPLARAFAGVAPHFGACDNGQEPTPDLEAAAEGSEAGERGDGAARARRCAGGPDCAYTEVASRVPAPATAGRAFADLRPHLALAMSVKVDIAAASAALRLVMAATRIARAMVAGVDLPGWRLRRGWLHGRRGGRRAHHRRPGVQCRHVMSTRQAW